MNTHMGTTSLNDKVYFRIIATISILIPVVVALLLYLPEDWRPQSRDLSFLPAFHAILNSLVSVALITGYVFIRNKNKTAHQWSMISAFALSAVFLISYVVYHSTNEPTSFGGEGFIKSVYYFILISHIILAAVILPLVLFTVYFASRTNFEKHRKIARYTFPLWLYVSVTGVLVYLLISPYYT
jgi:putative membrane protein